MSNKRNLSSQHSIDTIIKLNIKLRNNLVQQIEKFEPSKNESLLIELNKLLEFKNKKLKNNSVINTSETSGAYLEISIYDVEKVVDLLCKLDGYYHLKNKFSNLLFKLDKIKEEIIDKLIMLEGKPCSFEINDEDVEEEDINLNNNNNESNHNESNHNESNYNESNYNDPNESNYNDIIDEPIVELNNEPINQTISETINKSTNNEKLIDESLNNEKIINKPANDKVIEDLFSLVFEYLSVNDLFNCRLVNEQFKRLSDNTNGIKKLIIGEPYFGDEDYYWYYNNKLIEDQDIISLKCFRSIKLLSIFNLDKYLKYLKIYDQQCKSEELSNLINLESLEFGREFDNDKQQNINLNNLKVLASNGLSVKLNAPKLEKIKFYNINQIKLDSNPESIKHLITKNYDHKLEIFKNLEIMELRNIHKSIDENLLIMFKNLKELKIDLNFEKVEYSNKRIKNSLIKILNDKIKLKREIDIYIEGVKIENNDEFNKMIEDDYWKFILTNYDLIDLNISFIIDYFRYEELEECVNNIENDLPSTFFDRFQNVHQVSVSSVDDVNGLNWFLNNLKYLTKLYIDSKASLDEVFYNNLPNTIKYLFIDNKKDLNYDFILKLSKLIEFETQVDKDLFDLVFTSFENLKYLKEFGFYFKRKNIEIKKNGKDFYLKNEKLDYNQLVAKCNKIRSKKYCLIVLN